METIDLVANMNNLFEAVLSANKVKENACPSCLRETEDWIEMKEIDRSEDVKVYPISGPEVTRVNWIKYRCPECGEEVTIHQ